MANDNKGIWPVALAVIALIIVLQVFAIVSINGNTNKAVDKPVNIDLTNVTNAINDLSNKIDSQVTDNDKIDYIYEKESKKDVIEAKALEIATAYVNSKDFKKLVEDAIVEYSNESECDIESYKHITDIKVSDTEVVKVGTDTYEVTFEKVKIYYYVDGDEDETEKALLETFVITVNDVDYDEDFEDIETQDYEGDLEIAKIY